MTEVIDKNKSAFKLKGIGPIYCINLDGQTDRWEYMENQFKYWEIEDKVTRISAYDGREDDLSDILVGTYPNNMTGGEIGCTCLLYTSPSPRDRTRSRMPSSA